MRLKVPCCSGYPGGDHDRLDDGCTLILWDIFCWNMCESGGACARRVTALGTRSRGLMCIGLVVVKLGEVVGKGKVG